MKNYDLLAHITRGYADTVDREAVGSVTQMDQETRTLTGKTVAALLIELSDPDVLRLAAERVECLYWNATSGIYDFRHSEVDVFAGGVLMALEHHPDKDEALFIAAHLRRGRGVSQNKPGNNPPELQGFGPIAPTALEPQVAYE